MKMAKLLPQKVYPLTLIDFYFLNLAKAIIHSLGCFRKTVGRFRLEDKLLEDFILLQGCHSQGKLSGK